MYCLFTKLRTFFLSGKCWNKRRKRQNVLVFIWTVWYTAEFLSYMQLNMRQWGKAAADYLPLICFSSLQMPRFFVLHKREKEKKFKVDRRRCRRFRADVISLSHHWECCDKVSSVYSQLHEPTVTWIFNTIIRQRRRRKNKTKKRGTKSTHDCPFFCLVDLSIPPLKPQPAIHKKKEI